MLRIFWYLWWPLEQTEEITLNITLKWKDCSTNVNVRAMKIWVEKLGNTLFGVNSRIRTRDGICCQGILLPRFTGRFLDKNNETISTTASFFFHYRPVWWTVCAWNFPAVQLENDALDFSEKSLRSGLVKILISSLQLIFTRACYINYFDWLWSDIESVIVFHYFLKQGHLFSDPALYLFLFQQRLQISFQRKTKSIFQATVYSLHPTENLWQNMTWWLVCEIPVLRLLLFF